MEDCCRQVRRTDQQDHLRFGADIGPVWGYTDDNPKFTYFKEQGFDIFCNVDGNIGWTEFGPNYVRTGRVALDGVSMYDLRVAMLAADESFPEMLSVSSVDGGAKENFRYVSALDYEKVDSYFLSYAKDGAGYEIVVISLKDPSDSGEAVKSLKDHLEARINLYRNYSPADVSLAQSALVGNDGRYAYLIMCSDTGAVKAAMADILHGR